MCVKCHTFYTSLQLSVSKLDDSLVNTISYSMGKQKTPQKKSLKHSTDEVVVAQFDLSNGKKKNQFHFFRTAKEDLDEKETADFSSILASRSAEIEQGDLTLFPHPMNHLHS